MVIKGICSAQVSVEKMHILGLVWSRKMDLGAVNWMHAEGTMSRQTYQALVCTCFPHPSLCLQSYLRHAERYEPRNTVENRAESQFSWNIAFVLSGYVSGAETHRKQATVAASSVRVSTSSHGNVILSVKLCSPSCEGGWGGGGHNIQWEVSYCLDASPSRVLCWWR